MLVGRHPSELCRRSASCGARAWSAAAPGCPAAGADLHAWCTAPFPAALISDSSRRSKLSFQDALPPENFAWAPVGSSSGGGSAGQPMAMTAFSKLLATLTSASMLHNLCMSE